MTQKFSQQAVDEKFDRLSAEIGERGYTEEQIRDTMADFDMADSLHMETFVQRLLKESGVKDSDQKASSAPQKTAGTADDRIVAMNRLLMGDATLSDLTYEEGGIAPSYATALAPDTHEEVSPSPDVATEDMPRGGHSVATSEADGEPPLHLQDEFEYAQQQRDILHKLEERADSYKDFQNQNPSGKELFMAAMETHNPLASWYAQEPLPQLPVDPTYSPFAKRGDGSTDIDGYEQYYEAFLDSENAETTSILKQRIDRERKNQRTMQSGGVYGIIATVGAGITDPINLATAVATFGGSTVLTVGAKTAIAGISSVAVQETILHGTQETRTLEESAINVMSVAILDGALGGAVKYMDDAAKAKAFEQSVNTLKHASAAENLFRINSSGPEIVTNANPLNRIAAAMVKITPLGRTLQSQDRYVRSVVQELAETNIRVEGDYLPTSVESLVKLDYSKHGETVSNVRAMQRTWMKETGMDADTFSIELTSAMRRGDKHDNEAIQNAAQALRREVDELWERAAQQQIPGTFTRTVDGEGNEVITPYKSDTSESYLMRRYDVNGVKADPEGFKQAWIAGLKDQRARTDAAAIAENPNAKPLPELHENEWRALADDIYDKVIDLHVGDLHFNTAPSGATAFKQKIDIKDSFLEPYLVKDWEVLMDGYVKSVAPRVRMAERFGKDVDQAGEGAYDMSAQIARIKQRYGGKLGPLQKKISAATGKEKKTLQKQADKLQVKLTNEVRDIEIMRDRILNVTQEPSMMNPENRGMLSALRTARSWNIVTMLSNVVVSSIPDVARAITYNGGGKFARAFTKSALTKDIRRSNMPANETAKLASAMERTAAYRLEAISEVEDGVTYTRADKYAHWAADKVLTLSGMKHWNATQKTIVGHMYGDKVARALINGTDTAKLKQMGLTDDMIDMARLEAKKWSKDEGGLYNLGLDQWKNRQLVETIEAGAVKEADSMIVTPSAGDKPIWMTTEIGRTIGQFKSFMISATNKMLLPMMQEGGIRPWMEIMTSIGLGAGVYYLKAAASAREASEDPETVLIEAVENTGLSGYAMELFKMQQATVGFDPLGKEDQSKFYSRGPWGTLLGPSAGTAENAWKSVNRNISPEQRAKAMRKLLPFQNHYLLRNGFDKIEEEAAKVIPDFRQGKSAGVDL